MLEELDDLNEFSVVDFINYDESFVGSTWHVWRSKVVQHGLHIDRIIWPEFGLEIARSVLKPAFAVGVTPQTGECDAIHQRKRSEVLILEKIRFNVADARHISPPSRVHFRAKGLVRGLEILDRDEPVLEIDI